MLCPITQEVMTDPALCIGDGHSCERQAITRWLEGSNVSPVTGEPLRTKELVPNYALRSMIAVPALVCRFPNTAGKGWLRSGSVHQCRRRTLHIQT